MAKIRISSIAVMACAVVSFAADGTFVDFASAGPKYYISTGQFASPEDAARQMSVGPDGLTVLFDSAREGKPYRWATISVPRAVGGGRDWSTLRIRLLLSGMPTGKARRDIALNLTDAHGETFQYYPCGFSEDADGNLCLEYDFAGKHGNGWGGDGNHQMDLPARLSALNVHFGGEGTGRVTFRRIESAEDACGAARTVVSREPISTDTTYPGARPFNGPRTLTFEVRPAVSGTARLTLSSGSAGSAWQGRMDGFDGVVSNGIARFDLNLPYGRRYQFMKLQVKGETVRPVRAVGEFLQTEAEAMRLDVDTGNPLHLVRDGKEKPVLVVRNPAERAVSWRTAFVFRDVFGRRFEIPFAREMAAGEEVRVEVPGPLPAKGLWRVAANVTGGDGSRAFKETRFAFIDRHERTPIVEKPKFRFGIHYHGTHYWPHLLDLTVEALVAAGAKFTRCDYDHMWSDIERTQGVYDWTKSDAMIERLRNAGLALDIIMLSMPSWAIDETARAKAPDQRKRGLRVRDLPIKPGTFRAFAEVYARRYGTKIDYYEIGNEIDLTGAETLPHEAALAIQREAYEGLHAGCSNVCVTTCGWAGAYTSPDATPDTYNVGIQEVFAEHPELYDVWAQHVHGPFARFANVLDGDFAKLRERTPLKTRPWISNETALTSAFGEEDTVARNVWMKPLFAWSRGARDYIWYNLRATGWFDGNEPGYGLITADFHPRAGYAAFAALTTVFQGLDYDGAVYSRGLRHLLRFRGTSQAMPDGLVLAGWDDKLAADDSWTVRIATDATRAELCDHMGNRMPAQIDGGTVTFPISRNPQALLLFGASKAEAAEPLPKVWMSAQWRDPFSETIRLCAEQGVDVVWVPSWTTNHCAYALAALRKYKVKGFTASGPDPSEVVSGKTKDDIIAIRFGDECFNLTGWLDCPAASFPIWGFSPSGRAAFAREGRICSRLRRSHGGAVSRVAANKSVC